MGAITSHGPLLSAAFPCFITTPSPRFRGIPVDMKLALDRGILDRRYAEPAYRSPKSLPETACLTTESMSTAGVT